MTEPAALDAAAREILERTRLPDGVRLKPIAPDAWKKRSRAVMERAFGDDYVEREQIWSAETLASAERLDALVEPRVDHRYGLWADDALVGVYWGQQAPRGVYEMRLTAIVSEWQRRGLYSALLPQVVEAARAAGFLKIVSRHAADNNPILIAKLSHGFVIGGFTTSLSSGLQVELVCYLHEGARARHRRVVGA